MIISVPLHAAVWDNLAVGALVMLVAVQLSVIGLYFAPVFNPVLFTASPPHTIISTPDHTAV